MVDDPTMVGSAVTLDVTAVVAAACAVRVGAAVTAVTATAVAEAIARMATATADVLDTGVVDCAAAMTAAAALTSGRTPSCSLPSRWSRPT